MFYNSNNPQLTNKLFPSSYFLNFYLIAYKWKHFPPIYFFALGLNLWDIQCMWYILRSAPDLYLIHIIKIDTM